MNKCDHSEPIGNVLSSISINIDELAYFSIFGLIITVHENNSNTISVQRSVSIGKIQNCSMSSG